MNNFLKRTSRDRPLESRNNFGGTRYYDNCDDNISRNYN